ncbi:MAG: thiamine pyrophosphate-dependent enzyme [Treponema sp.]|nr:thiamine pyrophosphate-dependent enzyme [Treponema sp.]
MSTQQLALLGDEAVALGAIHAGISAAYAYPGTPSTEILQSLIDTYADGGPIARWCANEKTALEAAIGVSFAGRRALAAMKHVGLNVAADPFINAALLGIKGGLVIAVADDPGMHSSQDEQDSRFYAAFAMVPCLEPRSQQEAYDMTREAFDVSERYQIPVMLRFSTRLAHSRAGVTTRDAVEQKPVSKATEKNRWVLIPAFARKNNAMLVEKQKKLTDWSTTHPVNALELPGNGKIDLAVITAGLGGNYYEENLDDFITMRNGKVPARLHIGAYPLPEESIRTLCAASEKVLVLEEGQPLIEQRLRGIMPQSTAIAGKLAGFDGVPPGGGEPGPVTRTGELDPDNVRLALGLPPRPGVAVNIDPASLPPRPPQLCQGCPHCDSFDAIKIAAEALDPRPGHPDVGINSDIGCYSLGVAPPYEVPESIVCMGAAVTMAKGAADAGLKYSIGVIGDSTFIHSGITGLIDAVTDDIPMTLIILDNSVVAMTGCQPTMVPSEKLADLVLGCGVHPDHLLKLEAKKHLVEENAIKLKTAFEHRGLSVVIFKRECIEALRKQKKAVKGSLDGTKKLKEAL